MRGSVAMKTGPREAHVCLGNREVKVGDKVRAFRNVCPAARLTQFDEGGAGGQLLCRKEPLGDGTVIQLLNEHYSVVRFEPDVVFDDGTFVEKK